MNLIQLGLNKARVTIVIFVLLMVVGILNFISISRESMPAINIPFIYVSTSLDGISPEDSNRMLVQPIEDKIKSIDGIREVKTTAYEGGGNLAMEFDAGFDADTALDDVRNKVDEARNDLPDDATEPKILEINFSNFPIIQVIFSGPYDTRTLTNIAEDMQEELQTITAVLEANIIGGRQEQLELVIDPIVLENYGITTDTLLRQIQSYNLLIAAGSLESNSGKFSVKLPGLIENEQDISEIPLLSDNNGTITVGDVAEIKRTYNDATSIARSNGQNAIAIDIVKRTGANTIETVERVKQTVDEAMRFLPRDVEITYANDQSVDIRSMLNDLGNSVITSIILVMIVILGALGIRSGILISLSIPATLLVGISVLFFLDVSLNMIVLFATLLSIGMMVDASIVTVEFANRRVHEGASPFQAYGEASRRMARPIISSTITTLAAFLPLMFWPGLVGEVMKFLPMTLAIMLSAALLVALFFIPVLGAYFSIISIYLLALISAVAFGFFGFTLSSLLGVETGAVAFSIVLGILGMLFGFFLVRGYVARRDPHYQVVARGKVLAVAEVNESTIIDETKLSWVVRRYLALVKRLLRRPGLTVAGTFALMAISWIAFARFNYGVEFFPNIETDQSTLIIKSIGNYSLEERDEIISDVEAVVLAKMIEKGEIDSVTTKVNNERNDEKGTIGRINIDLKTWYLRRPAEIILQEVRSELTNIAGVTIATAVANDGPKGEKAIDMRISGEDYGKVRTAAEKIVGYMYQREGLRNITDEIPPPGIEWVLRVNREQSQKYGISLGQIGSYVRMATSGYKVSSYRPDDNDDEIDIVARFPESLRNIGELENIRINTANGSVPITAVVDRIPQQQSQNITRVDSDPTIRILSDVEPGTSAEAAVAGLTTEVAELNLDPSVRVSFGGDQANLEESRVFLIRAFLIAFFMIFIILLVQFNSFMHCLIITSAIVISTTGVLIGHLVISQPFGMILSGIGMVTLAGIVVNNNIVLIDTYDIFRKRVTDPIQAILLTCVYRFRPVMLTSITTILSVLPSMFQVNMDFTAHILSVGAPSVAFWKQISTSVFFGMTFATVLTLFIAPMALALTSSRQSKSLRRNFSFARWRTAKP